MYFCVHVCVYFLYMCVYVCVKTQVSTFLYRLPSIAYSITATRNGLRVNPPFQRPSIWSLDFPMNLGMT